MSEGLEQLAPDGSDAASPPSDLAAAFMTGWTHGASDRRREPARYAPQKDLLDAYSHGYRHGRDARAAAGGPCGCRARRAG